MDNNQLPSIFGQLQREGCMQKSDILRTEDGFFLIHKSLSDMLAEKGILDFPDADGVRLLCSKFFDDWFLYAVPHREDHVYGLLKLREQEHDAEDGSPADGDTPGVTISFISFSCDILLECLAAPTDENRMRLDGEINRTVARRGQRHHAALKRYFIAPRAEGSYLVASLYAEQIASFSEGGQLSVPEHYKEIVQRSISYKHAAKFARIPSFIETLNREAGYTVCDNETIYIKNPAALTAHEAAAILATHTGNTSIHSFAAEVEYHARFLMPIFRVRVPFFGRSIYDSAIRADMTIDDTEFEGPAPFYRADSKIVKRQRALHGERELALEAKKCRVCAPQ